MQLLNSINATATAELSEFVSFWAKGGVDSEGGFVCALDHEGNRLQDEKFIWYQGRGLWVYSRLFRQHEGGEDALAVAKKTFEFIRDEWRDDKGEWAIRTGLAGAKTSLLEGANPHSVASSG